MNAFTRIFVASFFVLAGTNARGQGTLDLTMFGNTNERIVPGDEVHLFLTATVQDSGQLSITIPDEQRPPFILTWSDKSIECMGDCILEATLVLLPGTGHCGDYEFPVIATFDGVISEVQTEGVIVKVYPRIHPQPRYTEGVQNKICWAGCEHNWLQVSPQLRAAGKVLQSTLGSDLECETVTGLVEGVEYEYVVTALVEMPDGSLDTLSSYAEYSTQDNSPPSRVEIDWFSVDEHSNVILSWSNASDTISFVDKYVVSRSELGVDSGFIQKEVQVVQVITDIEPVNYVIKADFGLGDTVYIDTDAVATGFPGSLRGTTMIKTAFRDRWNEADEFLRFKLGVKSNIYIAYDRSPKSPPPAWLQEPAFIPTSRMLQTSLTANRLKLYKSAETFPANTLVKLGGNFSGGVRLRNDTPMYVVFIEPLETVRAQANEVQFADLLPEEKGDELGRHTFRYRIDALDAAGNRATGVVSPPIIVDAKGECRPEIESWFVLETSRGRFAPGTTNTVRLKDPALNTECDSFRATDSVRFQAVRGDLVFFELGESSDSDEPADNGGFFFDSNWWSVEDLDSLEYTFDLLPENETTDFVDGKTYFYRAKAKDIHGNESAWSDTVDAIQDALPPGDISNLSVQAKVSEKACQIPFMQLDWNGASDGEGIGVAKYRIFRKFGLDTPYPTEPIDEIPASQTTYDDTLITLESSEVVCYKIGSTDTFEFEREIANSKWEACERALIAPQLVPDTSQLIVCDGITGTNRETVNVVITGNRNEVLKYIVTVNSNRITVRNPEQDTVTVSLDDGDGLYNVSVRAEYATGFSACSDTLSIFRKSTPPAPVQNLLASHDPERDGDILLEWDPVEPDSVLSIQVLKWAETTTDIDTISLPPTATSLVCSSQVAYQCYNFVVRVLDCFGNAADDTVSQYVDIPPVLLCSNATADTVNNEISVCWSRPFPIISGTEDFRTNVKIYDGFISDATLVDSVNVPDTCYTFENPLRRHNYVFLVQEVLQSPPDQSCPELFENVKSAWSDTCTVPFANLPRSVTTLEEQALPVHPDSSTGTVFLAWSNYEGEVDSFCVSYWPLSGGPSLTECLSGSDNRQVRGLNPDLTYGFTVHAVDGLGQKSIENDTLTAGFAPRWKFTPMVSEFVPGCFKDSVTVLWQWKDIPDPTTTCGAESVQIALSTDSLFNEDSPMSTTGWLSVTGMLETVNGPIKGSWNFKRAGSYPFVDNTNSNLFAQIRAKDKWAHVSPWSRIYSALRSQPGSFDELPPPNTVCKVADLIVGDIGDTAIVKLEWDNVKDACSGTAFYALARNDSVIFRDSTNHAYADTIQASKLETYRWKVFVTDSLDNVTPSPPECKVPTDISPPDFIYCSEESTVCWSPVEPPISENTVEYFAEGAALCGQLGRGSGRELSGWISDTCYTVDSLRSEDSLCWRVKTRFISDGDTVESLWSNVKTCPLGESITSVKSVTEVELPEDFILVQNFPNPFNPSTTIRFGLPASVGSGAKVSIVVFNLTGQRIRTLVSDHKRPGMHQVVWDGRDSNGHLVGSGVYIYQIRVGPFVDSKKMIFIK